MFAAPRGGEALRRFLDEDAAERRAVLARRAVAAEEQEEEEKNVSEAEIARLRVYGNPIASARVALQKIPLIGSRAPRVPSAAMKIPTEPTLAGVSAARKAAAIARGDADAMLEVLNSAFLRYTTLFNKACDAEYRAFRIRKEFSTVEDLDLAAKAHRMAEAKEREAEKLADSKKYRERQHKKRKIAKTKLGSDDMKSKAPTVFDRL